MRHVPSLRSSLLLAASLLGLGASTASYADEGMWTFDHLPLASLQKHYQFTPTPQWTKHVIQSSARLAEGCSASFVSADGLVMTNHHCANACLDALSDKNHDYFRNGFYTSSLAEERQCPAMELDRLDSIKDVSADIDRATAGKSGGAYSDARQAIEGSLTKECVDGNPTRWRCDIVSLYHGGQTALYRYRRYQDVRAVMAPEQDIAFFGGDPDNFNYPRYDIDLSMLRVYENGAPVHTPYLPFNPNGPKAGELVFTSGNPGRTQRGLSAAELRFQRDVINPRMIETSTLLEGMLWQYARQSDRHRQESQNTFFLVQNRLKAFSGIQESLRSSAIIAQRAQEDDALQAWINADPARLKQYGTPFRHVDEALTQGRALLPRYVGLRQALRGITGTALTLVDGTTQRTRPDAQRLAGFHDAQLGEIEAELGAKTPFYPELETATLALALTTLRQQLGTDDPLVHTLLGHDDPDSVAAHLVQSTTLSDPSVRLALWRGGSTAVNASSDPLIVVMRRLYPAYAALRKHFNDDVTAPLNQANTRIARARLAHAQSLGHADERYPDATFSPRLSYGTVTGWTQNGHTIAPFTTFEGMYQHATGHAPFALPQRWLDARSALKPDTKLDFVSTNDIVGGNSGSPVINRNGHAVGLIFDGNLPSLAGDLYYDITQNRAVATDTSAIISALRTVYHEPTLADELSHGHR